MGAVKYFSKTEVPSGVRNRNEWKCCDLLLRWSEDCSQQEHNIVLLLWLAT
jgi:hypothetical protein